MREAARFWQDLQAATDALVTNVVFDLSEVRSADSGIIALLVERRRDLAARGVRAEIVGANPMVESIVALYSKHERSAYAPMPRESLVAEVGRATAEALSEAKALLAFLGDLVAATGGLLRNRRSGNWKGFAALCEKVGANAVPIVLLINFLVGFVMAFQSAKQLKLYGANIYVADLVGISLTRELAPLMTSIIVCGRSGAAFAAELGSMKVNEEIDALRTLGLRPFEWLVIPRVTALLIVVPLLTLLADAVGILGGLVVGITDLDVGPRGYIKETITSVQGWDILTGLIKSTIFAVTIALIACQQGMATSGGAEDVGRRTTSAVVVSLFALVTLDALMTVIFRMLQI